ncbi:MAG: hypothetical protein KAT00_10005 [Planctomycetes bacterium]|nr:hypothetical protein [Planctomycetota bacterium]
MWSWRLFLVAALIGASHITALAGIYSGGTGDPNDPYQIWDANDMQAIGANPTDWDKHFKLMADIDLGEFTGNSYNIIGTYSPYMPFSGVFDGNDYSILNFTYRYSTIDRVGLFGWVNGANAEIRDLTLINPEVDAGTGMYVSALVGYLGEGVVKGCVVEGGSIKGDRDVGAIVGYNRDNGIGYVIDCHASAFIEGNDMIGGLVGGNSIGGVITNCSSSCVVIGNAFVGGLVGYATEGIIYNCTSNSDVFGMQSVGGLLGRAELRTIKNCYVLGSVTGYDYVGGLIGKIHNAPVEIINCFSACVVDGIIETGGLVGTNDNVGSYTDCFWDVSLNPFLTGIGNLDDPPDVIAETTGNLQIQSTYTDVGWDFVDEVQNGSNDEWAMPADGGYPILLWQLEELPELPVFSGGLGTLEDPYLISSPEELNSIGHNDRLMGSHYKLISDIDMTGFNYSIIGANYSPFTGTFDGNGHEISNVTINANFSYVGLFGYIEGDAVVIKDLGLINAHITGGSTNYFMGSLVGRLRGGIVTRCYSTGGTVSGNEYVGGLVGFFAGNLSSCYAVNTVSGSRTVGGISGQSGNMENCYSGGVVSGDSYVGALVGKDYGSAIVTSSFWDNQIGGPDNGVGTGLSTELMQTMSTFTDSGWDFVGEDVNGTENIWRLCADGVGYPELAWQSPIIGDVACPDGVSLPDFGFFASRWRETGCENSNDCGGTDFDGLGSVDPNDFTILMGNWLLGL